MRKYTLIIFPILFILTIGSSYILHVSSAFEFHSEIIENFLPEQTFSHIINLTETDYIYYNIRTEKSFFRINITKVGDSLPKISQISEVDPNGGYQLCKDSTALFIAGLTEEKTEYNITITNIDISVDTLFFSLKFYNKTPELITGIRVDDNLLLGQILSITTLIIPCVSVIISKRISKIKSPSKRRLLLKRFGITIITIILLFFLGEVVFFFGGSPHTIDTDNYETKFEKGWNFFNFPLFSTSDITVVFKWTEIYDSEENEVFLKTIELVNSSDDSYTLSIIHDCSRSTETLLTNYTRLTIPKGNYIIFGGENITWSYANPISEINLSPFSLFIFTIINAILGLLLIYHSLTFKFKIKVKK